MAACRRSDGDIKAAEMTKRKLSADLALTKAHLDIKKRDGECPSVRYCTGDENTGVSVNFEMAQKVA